MRLTKKSEKFINAYEWNRELPTKTFVQLGMNKLGSLEDIEDETGIDLVVLFKAIRNGIWVKTKNGISKHLTVVFKKRHHTKEYWLFYRPYSHIYFKDYGKTWALTREELER